MTKKKHMTKQEAINDFVQSVFREQANKKIELTKRMLDSKAGLSFASVQKKAFEATMFTMQAMGIYDINNKITDKCTVSEAETIFEAYYARYIKLESFSISGRTNCRDIEEIVDRLHG